MPMKGEFFAKIGQMWHKSSGIFRKIASVFTRRPEDDVRRLAEQDYSHDCIELEIIC